MEDELDEYSINLTTWNAANGLFCETADELAVDFKDRIVLAIKKYSKDSDESETDK